MISFVGNRYGTRLLQKVEVPIISNKECEMWHHWKGINVRIFPEMLCAGFENGQKDACVVRYYKLITKIPFNARISFFTFMYMLIDPIL